MATNSTTFVESDSFVAADRVETRRLSTDVGVGGSTDTFLSKDGVDEEEVCALVSAYCLCTIG